MYPDLTVMACAVLYGTDVIGLRLSEGKELFLLKLQDTSSILQVFLFLNDLDFIMTRTSIQGFHVILGYGRE